MKVIVPDTIDLALTNVAADSYPIWHHGERYDIGDYVQYQGSTPHKVYKSLRAYNQNKRPPDHTTVEEIETHSSSSVAIGTGSKTFTIRGDLNIVIGTIVTVAHPALPGSYSMTGEVTGYYPSGSSPSPGTPSRTESASPSATASHSPSAGTPSRTESASPSGTASTSPSRTPSPSPSDSPSATESGSPSATKSGSPSASPSGAALIYPLEIDPLGSLPSGWSQVGSPAYSTASHTEFDMDEYLWSNGSLYQVNELYAKAKVDTTTLSLDASEGVKLLAFYDDSGEMAYVHLYSNGGTLELRGYHGSETTGINVDSGFSYFWARVQRDSGSGNGVISVWANTVDDLGSASGPVTVSNGTGGDSSGIKNVRVGPQTAVGVPTDTATFYSLYLDTDQHGGTASASPSGTASGSPSRTASASPTEGTASTSPSEGTPSRTASTSPSGTASTSPSEGTPSRTESASPSSTVSGSPSDSPSATVSGSPSATPSEGTEYSLVVNVLSTVGTGTFSKWLITNDDTVAFWEKISSTNQYKMLDESVNSKTTRGGGIEVEFNTTNADAVALFGVYAKEVVVEFWDSTESELYYTETVDLVYGSDIIQSISDWWEYFYGEFTVATEVVVQADMVTHSGVVKVDLTQSAGVNAECGNLVLGRVVDIGQTRYGSGVGILDYSSKETDEDGVITITEGYWAKEHNYTLVMENRKMTSIYKTVAGLRASPTAWIAADDSTYDLFITYAILRDFSITVPGPTVSIGNLELEGLT